MAFLSISSSFHTIRSKTTTQDLAHQTRPRSVPTFVACQTRFGFDPPTDKENDGKEEKKPSLKVLVRLEKLGKGIKESLSPKRKGDWKDLVLMSLSFAVYVYISQRIVCAYCAWNSMFEHHW